MPYSRDLPAVVAVSHLELFAWQSPVVMRLSA